MITIQELNAKYKATDPHWDFTNLEPWLLKKGIEHDIIDTTLKQTLMDFDLDTLPETHHIFDNTVLIRALVTKEKLRKTRMFGLEEETIESVNKSDKAWYSKSKLERIWLIITGKD